MGTTNHFQIPYPQGPDAADGHRNMMDLATRVDDVLYEQLGQAGQYVTPALTLSNANFTLNGSWAYKFGKMVTLMMAFTSKNALGPGGPDGNIADITLGNVVAGYRPMGLVYFPAGWGRNFLSLSIASSNGETAINSLLSPNMTIAANQQFWGNTTFIAP